ncbi:hypothetical protein CGLO_06363 [Colletotrichum gloeosporioides Cg-14]|uniref:Uncharacterized protein n=1 Tax=Colletotrichum gloeosporioides (strain Cg-14) TaxID=1237896 RepID=T0KPB4_COLGC|nr:hypothetical protein CGLO_06363 [Colletotrichum gloeosporioides Cg-14]
MALFIGDAFSRDEGCNIELLNINQAVVDSAFHVNGNCGVGLDDDQQLDPSNSLRKAGFC